MKNGTRRAVVSRFGIAIAMLTATVCAAPALAVCGTSTEKCGDGIDNDCDGAVDEGCSLIGTNVQVPYVFSTAIELKNHAAVANTTPGATPTTVQNYSNNVDYRWSLAASHHAYACRYSFHYFDLEPGFDYLDLGPWSGNGLLAAFPGAANSVWSAYTYFTGTTSLPQARFVSDADAGVVNRGFQTDNVQCYYIDDGGTPNWKVLPLNTGVDGVLLHAKDDAYFQIAIPAGREAHVNLDAMGASQDIDLFATLDGTINATRDCTLPDLGACTSESTGEYLYIPYSASARTVYLRVHSYSGVGRYRLFAASQVRYFRPSYTLDVGIDKQIEYTWEIDRVNLELTNAVTWLLGATDGQYFINKRFYITDNADQWPMYSYEIFLSSDNTISDCSSCTACTPAATHGADWVEVPKWFWRGETKSCYYNNATSRQVGEVLAHEWGHYDFGLADEYTSASLSKCTHSLMSGAAGITYIPNDHRSFEFCSSKDHGTSPEPGTTGATGSSNWTNITAKYSNLVGPSSGGTVISSDFSQMSNLLNINSGLRRSWVVNQPILGFVWNY